MKRTQWRRKPAKRQKTPLKRTKAKKTTRAKKQELKRLLCQIYGLPILPCARWGTGKNPTRQDILKGMLWYVFSRWIRHRDAGKCIACGLRKTFEELQAGHFAPVGGNDLELCFDEHNVNGECESCNADFRGNGWHLIEMRKNMIKKYGKDEVEIIENLQSQRRAIKWEESKYADKIKFYYSELSTLASLTRDK